MVKIDAETAKAIKWVRGKLKKRRAMFVRLPIKVQASIAWKLINKFGPKENENS